MNLVLYFSSWIANFGVVPLLLLAAFLLRPIFLSLLDLLFLEIRVFETITSLLADNIFQHSNFFNKIKYLPTRSQTVKTLTLITFATVPYIVTAQAKSNPAQTILMAKGEHKDWKLTSKSRFTIGNPEVISHKFSNKNKTLLIKGKKLGFTELIIWGNKKSKKLYHIYVLSKQKHLKILHLAQTLGSIGLKVETAGPLLIVRGEVLELNKYRLIQELKSRHSNDLHLEITLGRKLRNHIIGEVYNRFYNENIKNINCNYSDAEIQCTYPEEVRPSPLLIKALQKKFKLKFFPITLQTQHNFLVKIKLFQFENIKGDEFQLGLEQLSGSLSDVFSKGLVSLIENNRVLLQKNNLSLSTLAEPQLIMQNRKSGSIEIGSNIPYPTIIGDTQRTEWKFAGLKVILKVRKWQQGYNLDFKIEFTRPSGNGEVSGSLEESSAFVLPKKPFNLFQIGFQSLGSSEKKLPGLSSIPFLGRLFTSTSTQVSYKKISAYITIEELYDIP